MHVKYIEISVNARKEKYPKIRDGVEVTTAHSVKGLEFPFVILSTSYQGHFPLKFKDREMKVPPELLRMETKQCPKCGNERLYRLKDNRFKCSACFYKYSTGPIKKDLKLLHYFSLEIPANKAVKDLGWSYHKIRNNYMNYRVEIFDYLADEYKILSG